MEETKQQEHRPWGYFEVLTDRDNFKSKQIVVYPEKRLSLQRHRQRAEHWYVIEGEAEVTRDSETLLLKPGQSTDIPRGAAHRIKNMGRENLVIIEIQTGDYFGEDDIERLEDDFGRV